MKNIIIFTRYYLPGYKGGGPIKSVQMIAKALQDDFNIFIITMDRDLGDKHSYQSITVNEWNNLDKYKVLYLSSNLSYHQIINILKTKLGEIDTHLYYINGLFDFNFNIFPIILMRLGIIKKKPILIAPRGELDSGALKIKKYKKVPFLLLANLFRIYDSIYWHATCKEERNFILQNMRNSSEPIIVENLSLIGDEKKNLIKKNDELKVIFLSRITTKKNLDYAIERIIEAGNRNSQLKYIFDIYGTLEDQDYWEKCNALIKTNSNPNVLIEYKGVVTPQSVWKILSNYEMFLFPTKGENFGHVIVESLGSGVPVILSNNTPWNDVEDYKAGWNLDLSNPDKFCEVLNECAQMNHRDWNLMSENSKKYIKLKLDSEKIVEKTKKMFLKSME